MSCAEGLDLMEKTGGGVRRGCDLGKPLYMFYVFTSKTLKDTSNNEHIDDVVLSQNGEQWLLPVIRLHLPTYSFLDRNFLASFFPDVLTTCF